MPETETSLLGIVGAGGFGIEVSSYATEAGLRTVFIETDNTQSSGSLSPAAFAEGKDGKKTFIVAVANSNTRRALADELRSLNISAGQFVDQSAFVSPQASIGQGAIVCPYTCITSNAVIGEHFHANIYSYVAHDCVIGDYVTFAPRVCCNGNVHIKDGAYIGTGAMIRQGQPGQPLVIGRNAIVGMGAVVLENVPDGATVVGAPAKIIEKSASYSPR